MFEMKLNTTAVVDSVGLDPVNVVPYQKTRKLRDRPLILQQIRVRRPRTGKLHKLPVRAHIDVEIELIKADFSGEEIVATESGDLKAGTNRAEQADRH
jgi:hypothetical protein